MNDNKKRGKQKKVLETVRKKARSTGPTKLTKFWVSCSQCGERRQCQFVAEGFSWLERHAEECPYLLYVPDKDAKLDCYFCATFGSLLERLVRFKDFRDLGLHVEQYHSQKGEEQNMLKAPGSYSSEGQQRGRGNRDRGPKIPWLSVDNLSEESKPARILAVKTDNLKFNNVVVLKLAFSGRTFFLGLRDNDNFEALTDALGLDEEKWIGQSFMVRAEVDDFTEKAYMRIEEAPATEKKGGKK